MLLDTFSLNSMDSWVSAAMRPPKFEELCFRITTAGGAGRKGTYTAVPVMTPIKSEPENTTLDRTENAAFLQASFILSMNCWWRPNSRNTSSSESRVHAASPVAVEEEEDMDEEDELDVVKETKSPFGSLLRTILATI